MNMPTHLPYPRLFAFALLPLALALPLAPLNAQDVTIGAPVTFIGLDDGQERAPLKLTSSPKPEYPPALRDASISTYDYVIAFSPTARDAITGEIFASPAWAAVSVLGRSTRAEIEYPCLTALRDWQWEAGKNDPRQAWVAILFNPASAVPSPDSKKKKDGAPRLLDVVPVFVPDADYIPPGERLAQADVTVGVAGEIKDVKIVSPDQFASQNATAITGAVSKWKFAPARANGRAIEATVRVPVLLLPALPAGKPAPAHITLLKVLKQADAVYPKDMSDSGEVSKVTLEFALDKKGRPQNPVVVLSPNAAFDKPALDTISQYRFALPPPGKPDSLGNICAKPDDARWQYELIFTPRRMVERAFHAEQRTVYDSDCGVFTASQASAPIVGTIATVSGTATIEGQNITSPVLAPKNVKTVTPVYPYELLVRNVTGSATVRVPCNTGWPDVCPEIIRNSYKNLGYALAAAARYYTSEPKLWNGKPVAGMLTIKFDFNPANPDLHLTPKTMQLLADETQNPGKIIPEDKLDSPLNYRQTQIPNPASLPLYVNGELKGVTIVEFLVDETGRVHLPRIIQTNMPEIAYILMQGISMRAYDPPMQNGKPVVARAREEVNFDAVKK